MEIVTLREFARRIGVSLTAIQKGIKQGRIQAMTNPETGRVTGIDYSTQAEAWEVNCKSPERRAHNQAGGRPKRDGSPAAAPKTAPKTIHAKDDDEEVITRMEPQAHGGALKRQEAPPPKDGGMKLADIQRARELVKLQIDNIKLKEANDELVSRHEQEKVGHELGSGLISDLYNLPERLSDELAGMTDPNAIHKLLTTEIDNMVTAIRDKLYAS